MLLMSGLTVILFLGGWLSPFSFFPFSLIPTPFWFGVKLSIFVVLFIAGTLLLINNKSYGSANFIKKKFNFFFSFLIGLVLGLVSGIVGIGGGIFLSPILFIIKADKPKNISTHASIFILINSISGLLGQLT